MLSKLISLTATQCGVGLPCRTWAHLCKRSLSVCCSRMKEGLILGPGITPRFYCLLFSFNHPFEIIALRVVCVVIMLTSRLCDSVWSLVDSCRIWLGYLLVDFLVMDRWLCFQFNYIIEIQLHRSWHKFCLCLIKNMLYMYKPQWNKLHILSFDLVVEKIESSGAACLLCLTHDVWRRPTVCVCERVQFSCSCCWALWGLKCSLGSLDWQHSQDTTGPHPSLTAFLSSFSLFLLSSTFSLCFTLCLHITLWVVMSWNIWSFSGPLLSGSYTLQGCRKFSSCQWRFTG